MPCHFFSLSDPGRLRSHNEDALAVDAERGWVVLADGMGGYNAGEVASELAVRHIMQYLQAHLPGNTPFDPRTTAHQLKHSVQAANLAIHAAAASRPDWQGMATTVVVAAFGGQRLVVAHVGDSRVYRLRQGQLTPITRDHSLLQEQIDAGVIPAHLAHQVQYKNLVTRAVGAAPALAIDVNEHTIEAGDTYLLCSDGLNDMLSDAHMSQVLRRENSLAAAGQVLLRDANAAGGHDNISFVLVQCQSQPHPPSQLLRA